ncbi:MAG: hypothetical protein LOD87_13185, partial [Planifilum fulgidum]
SPHDSRGDLSLRTGRVPLKSGGMLPLISSLFNEFEMGSTPRHWRQRSHVANGGFTEDVKTSNMKINSNKRIFK